MLGIKRREAEAQRVDVQVHTIVDQFIIFTTVMNRSRPLGLRRRNARGLWSFRHQFA